MKTLPISHTPARAHLRRRGLSREVILIASGFVLATALGACSQSDDPVGASSGDGDGDGDGDGNGYGTGGRSNPELCGNNRVDDGEQCDGGSSVDCETLGFGGGTLSCTSTCSFDTSQCERSFVINLEPSRLSCIAPCAVFFDVSNTQNLAEDDFVRADFQWDFDSTGVEPAQLHRRTTGFFVAHVFRNPSPDGSGYEVAVRARDVSGEASEATVSIEVTEPSGPIFYVAEGGNDSGEGTIADPLATVSEAMSRREPETRILLRQGDRFEENGLRVSEGGPLIIGSYEDPGQASSELPILDFSSGGSVMANDSVDFTLMDVHILTTNQSGISSVGSLRNLFLNVEIESTMNGEQKLMIVTSGAEEVVTADCYLHTFEGYGIFSFGDRQAIIGTRMDDFSGGQHGFRMNSGTSFYMAENNIDGDENMTSFTFRGGEGGTPMRKIVAVGNFSAEPVSFTPQNLDMDERVSEVLVEGNRFAKGLTIEAQNLAIRNNLFFDDFLNIKVRNYLLPEGFVGNITIDNNSFYSDENPTFVTVEEGAHHISFRNNAYHTRTVEAYATMFGAQGEVSQPETFEFGTNLVFAPNIGQVRPYFFNGEAFTPEAWLAETGAATVEGDPLFQSTDFTDADALRPDATGAGVDTGAPVAVYGDLERALRPVGEDDIGEVAWDLGAYELVQ